MEYFLTCLKGNVEPQVGRLRTEIETWGAEMLMYHEQNGISLSVLEIFLAEVRYHPGYVGFCQTNWLFGLALTVVCIPGYR